MAELTLEQHLTRHLRFIAKSCDGFDAGDVDEAIRIAVSLRVLMHTGGGMPLLDQLPNKNIALKATNREIGPNVIWSPSTLSCHICTIRNGAATSEASPNLDFFPDFHRLLPWKQWWSETVSLIDGIRLSRGDIATAAANKEGAHIAPRLPPGYKALQAASTTFQHIRGEEVLETQVLDGLHYTDLRQMAHEVVTSPDLLGYM